ncbi:hypothetical protein, partial [Salmonella sp. s54395]|uniref:hypothetical protein n=1 Tax=Salmonella sp. s54395 TaxID=3159664 RepID=UPI003980813B
VDSPKVGIGGQVDGTVDTRGLEAGVTIDASSNIVAPEIDADVKMPNFSTGDMDVDADRPNIDVGISTGADIVRPDVDASVKAPKLPSDISGVVDVNPADADLNLDISGKKDKST